MRTGDRRRGNGVFRLPSSVSRLLIAFALALSLASAAAWAGHPAVSPQDVKEVMERAEARESSLGQVLEKARENREAQRRARKSYEKFRGQVLPEVEGWKQRIKVENGRVNILPGAGEKPVQEASRGILQPDERLYIFMSSSVPKAVWEGYARDLDRLRDPNAVMVLRGCIGGCKYIRPTLEFVQSIVAPEGEDGKKLFAQVWIDPYLFRLYGINQVPCVVFAREVHPMADASEGTLKNLRSRPDWAVSCGDWALEYHLKELSRKTKARSLTALLRKLGSSWFEEKRKK